MKQLAVFVVKFYRKWISPLFAPTCRYYPTCSQYALQQLKFSNFIIAIFAIILRILKCNQLFKGGIDYPVIRRDFVFLSIRPVSQFKPNFWFVPCEKNKFYIIKAFSY